MEKEIKRLIADINNDIKKKELMRSMISDRDPNSIDITVLDGEIVEIRYIKLRLNKILTGNLKDQLGIGGSAK